MCNGKMAQLLCVLLGLLLMISACGKNNTTSSTGPIEEADGSFVAMAVGRTITNVSGYQTRIDIITARFDSSYAPCNPVTPVQVNAITCNEYTLGWESDLNCYQYMDVIYNIEFIDLGGEYIYTITGNSEVPSFVDTINFPVNETYVTSPSYYGNESLSGFDVTWESGNGSGTV
ncbi:MAG: hypothetical protein GY865_04315, partial [candidate division Zixibacteria bacterium]|nr:hypothetical protein [candidate division Zixibacteria bacterium]